MPKQPTDNKDQSVNAMEHTGMKIVEGMIPFPVMMCGVNRKINTGNFENIDVFSGIGVPIMAFPHEDLEAFREAALAAADLGFSLASRSTGDRYTQLKELQSGDKR